MNDEKFVLLYYNKNPQITNNYTLQSGIVIPERTGTRDLGVFMSNTAMFSEHLASLATSCRKIMSMILRSFTTREDKVIGEALLAEKGSE